MDKHMNKIRVWVKISPTISRTNNFLNESALELDQGTVVRELIDKLELLEVDKITLINRVVSNDEIELRDGDHVYIVLGLSGG